MELETPGRASQTDILALVTGAQGYGVIAVEGKAREPYDKLVSEWNVSPGKQMRLENLCAHLGLNPGETGGLRYQLLHRTVSALHEARRYGATEALMLVHSFDPGNSSLGDYQRFAASLGLTGAEVDTVTDSIVRDGCNLRLAWVKER